MKWPCSFPLEAWDEREHMLTGHTPHTYTHRGSSKCRLLRHGLKTMWCDHIWRSQPSLYRLARIPDDFLASLERDHYLVSRTCLLNFNIYRLELYFSGRELAWHSGNLGYVPETTRKRQGAHMARTQKTGQWHL